MYNVSDAYKAAIEQPSRQFELGGEIRLKSGEIIPITDDTVWDKGDVVIETRAMSADDETDIGACSAAILEMTIVDVNMNHLYADAEIELICSLVLENGEKEAIPMGTFYVGANVAKRTGKRFELTAYDAMIKLQYLLTDDMRAALKGLTGYQAAAYLYEGEMAQDEETVTAFPNGDLTLDFSSEQIETARDAVMWIGHLMGCFTRIDRLGRLEFVQLQPHKWIPAELEGYFIIQPERYISANQRFKTEFSDKAQQIFTLIMRDKDNKPVYHRSNPSEGTNAIISFETESNPLALSQTTRSISDILKNIVNGSLHRMLIQTFRSEIANDPALEAGDYVQIQRGGDNDAGNFHSMITHNIWRYRGHHEIRSGASMQTVPFDAPVAAALSARRAQARGTTAAKTYVQPISQSEKAARNQTAGSSATNTLVYNGSNGVSTLEFFDPGYGVPQIKIQSPVSAGGTKEANIYCDSDTNLAFLLSNQWVSAYIGGMNNFSIKPTAKAQSTLSKTAEILITYKGITVKPMVKGSDSRDYKPLEISTYETPYLEGSDFPHIKLGNNILQFKDDGLYYNGKKLKFE